MPRYIDADKLYDEIKSLRIHISGKDIFPEEAKESVLKVIDESETKDAPKVKHGQFVKQYDELDIDRGWMCSNCRNSVYSMTFEPYRFCPHCGAKMEEKMMMEDPTIMPGKLDEIIAGCKKRMDVSYYKYGAARENFASGRVDAIGSMELCLKKFEETKNNEYLLDVINYAAFRILFPMPGEYFRATDSSESAGVDGEPVNWEDYL